MKTPSINTGASNFFRQLQPLSLGGNTPLPLDEVTDSKAIKAILTKKYLQGLDARPRVHNNGFIQLDLTPRRRLHIWGHPDIPKSQEKAMIHDHIFGFRSWALVGKLQNVTYDLDFNGNKFEIYKPRITNGYDSVLEPTGIFCSLRLKHTTIIAAKGNLENLPDYYNIEPYEFHETFVSEPTATVIEKTGDTLAQNPNGPRPRVLVPVGEKTDRGFSRYSTNTENLWKIIEEVLNL